MINNVLVVMPVTEEHKKILEESAPEAVFEYTDSENVTRAQAANADVIVGNINPELIRSSSRLQLLQLNSAGTDGYTAPGVLPAETILTNATGAYGLAISEHMLGMVLTLMKKIDMYKVNQLNRNWQDMGEVKSIYGSKTLVVGLGDIGSEFAKRMHALGSSVTGIRRNQTEVPDYVDSLYQMDSLLEILPNYDIVATCLPGVSDTYKIFGKEAFSKMKKDAIFVNVGRGNAVDHDALYDALTSGSLFGACLDVTDPEPLPVDHRLWSVPNVIITPHVSGGYHLKETHNRIIRIAARNIRHLLCHEPIENIIDMTTGYRKL